MTTDRQIWRVWARKNLLIEGRTYLAGARINCSYGRAKNFKSYEGAVSWCRERFGDRWPEHFEIALR